MNKEDLCYLSATEMAKAVRDKQLSPVEISEAVLERIEELNPKLNAFFTVTAELAMEAAKRAEAAVATGGPLGALHGVPVSFKDSMHTRGVRTTLGSKILEHNVPDENAPVVERVLSAGAIMLGKTTMPEFAWKAMTDSPLQGITRNPWNLECTPGGSSGGASAQIAAGMGPLAMGTDGGGSIRIPASFAGIYGIKPSFGRIPVYPSSAFDALSHTGPMTRTVADAALALAVASGPHPADRLSLEGPAADHTEALKAGIAGLRVCWSRDLGYATVDGQVKDLTSAAARVFAELGCHVEEATPDFGDFTEVYRTFFRTGVATSIGGFLDEREDELDPGLVNIGRAGLELSAVDVGKAQVQRHQLYDRVRRFFEKYDLLLTPSVAVPPFRAGAPSPEPEHGHGENWIAWAPFSFPFNLTQVPAASVPAGFSAEGLPVGLQIVGPRLADIRVLQASAAYETARPWTQHRPSIGG